MRTLEPEEFLPAALAKVVAEAAGLRAASEPDRLDELWEIQSAVITACGLSWDSVLERATQRREQRGGFENPVLLVTLERP